MHALLSIALLAAPCSDPDDARPAPEFRPLFDGESLAGWWGCGTENPRVWSALPEEELAAKKESSLADIQAHWSVQDGELINDGSGLYLTTLEDVGDFELLLDYRTVAGADSGIYLRGIPQVQIWDTTEAGGKWNIGADKGSGGLWNNSAGAAGKDPSVLADKPFGEWNHFRIVMVGERVTVWLNGRRVVDHARMENYFERARPVPAQRGPTDWIGRRVCRRGVGGCGAIWARTVVPSVPAKIVLLASPTKRPCSTTPTTSRISLAASAASGSGEAMCRSTM